jgi:hypothetical protein
LACNPISFCKSAVDDLKTISDASTSRIVEGYTNDSTRVINALADVQSAIESSESSIDNHIDVLLLEIGTQTSAIDAAIVGLGVSIAADFAALGTDLDAAFALSTSTLVATLGATNATTINAITGQTTSLDSRLSEVLNAIQTSQTAIVNAINIQRNALETALKPLKTGGWTPIYASKFYDWKAIKPLTPGFPTSGTVKFSNYAYYWTLPVNPNIDITFTFSSGSTIVEITDHISYLQNGNGGDWVVMSIGANNKYQVSIKLQVI